MSLLDATVTDADLAELTGYDPRHIRRLATEGKLPRSGRNSYPLGDAIKALLKHTSDQGESSAMQAAKLRKLEADASMAELELAKACGQVAAIADFERVQESTAILIRTNMLSLPNRVVTQLLGETDESAFKATLKREITQVLTDAAQAVQTRAPDDLDNDND